MKATIISLLLISANLSFSLDTTSTKYFPLKVGNRWVYNHHWYWSGDTRIDWKIIDTLNTNGHKYYKLRQKNAPPSMGYIDLFVRIDSITGSIKYYETTYPCSWLINEINGDSLSSRYLDSFIVDCNWFWKAGRDTLILVFGQLRSIKGYIGSEWPTYVRGYVYGLGMKYDYFYYVQGTSWQYDLIGCVIDGVVFGDTSMVGINQISSEIPTEFKLYQNYPNPFNSNSKIKFQNAKFTNVKLSVYDILGREITTLVNEQLQPGTYEVEFDGTNYPSGIYFYKLTTGDALAPLSITKKMVLIK